MGRVSRWLVRCADVGSRQVELVAGQVTGGE